MIVTTPSMRKNDGELFRALYGAAGAQQLEEMRRDPAPAQPQPETSGVNAQIDAAVRRAVTQPDWELHK